MCAKLAIAGLTLAALLAVGCEEEHHDHDGRHVYRDRAGHWDRDDWRHHDWDARPAGERVYPYHDDYRGRGWDRD